MEQKIDWQAALDGSRPVTTRDGRKVTLYCIDASGDWPVHGRIEGEKFPVGWKINGSLCEDGYRRPLDLIQPPRRFKYERWVNVYEDGSSSAHHPTKEVAGLHKGYKRIACVKVVVEGVEGEGLE